MCDTGYNHSTGDLVRTCQNDGTWSGALPACPSKFRTLNGKVRSHWYFGIVFFRNLRKEGIYICYIKKSQYLLLGKEQPYHLSVPFEFDALSQVIINSMSIP